MPSHPRPRNPDLHPGPNDPNESDDLSLRAPRSAVSGIRKRYIRLVPIALVVVIAAALIIGLGINFHPSHVGGKHNIDLPPRNSRPANLSLLPDNYNQIPAPQPTPKPESAPPDTQSATISAKSATGAQDALRRKNAELRRNLASMMAAIKKIDTKNQQLLDAVNRYQDQAHKDQAKAWGSPVLIKIDDKHSTSVAKANTTPPPPENPETPAVSKITRQGTDRVPIMSLPNTAAGVSGNGNTSGGSGGQRAFLRQSPAPKALLNEPYLYPLSPYEVQAGTVIPAALLTGINTDLPGEVVAVVTAPVYDSATGRHELIPQGAKLLGAYDSEIGNGQNRALLVWHRLVMPNGRSITLDHMPGTDAAGYAGVADRVDYHAGKLAVGTVLSSILAYAGNLARSPGSSPGSGAVGNTTSGGERDVIGDTVAQQAVRVGSKIIDRQLNVQPTITVRPGWPVRVLVNKDITLAPYRP